MNRTRNLLSFGMSAALDQPRIMKPKPPIVNRKLAAVLHTILSICSVGQENCRPPRPRSSVMDPTLGGSTVTSSVIPPMMRIRHHQQSAHRQGQPLGPLLQPSLGHQRFWIVIPCTRPSLAASSPWEHECLWTQ